MILLRVVACNSVIYVVIVGCVVGSFLTAIQNRLDNLKSILYDRSRCPKCNHILGVLDLFPILSFVFLRGKCRFCKSKISFLYPVIELITVGLAFFVYYYFGESWQSLVLFFSLCTIFLAAISDIKSQEVDIWIFTVGILIALAWRFSLWCSVDTLYDVLLGGASAALLPFCLSVFSREKWMGYGDSLFALWIGILCGFPTGLIGIFLAFLLGSIFGIIVLVSSKNKKAAKTKIPFGPFIALGGIIALSYGSVILENYLKLLGY